MAKKSNDSPKVFVNDDWQVEEDLRTLQRAREVRKDAKRMAKVRALAKEQLKALNAEIDGK